LYPRLRERTCTSRTPPETESGKAKFFINVSWFKRAAFQSLFRVCTGCSPRVQHCSCRKFYLASRPGLSIGCSIMSHYLSTVSFLRPSMAPNLAASRDDLIRDMILDESLTICFASGWRVNRAEASGMFQMEVSGTCWNHQVAVSSRPRFGCYSPARTGSAV
jgi:hypothetical protein